MMIMIMVMLIVMVALTDLVAKLLANIFLYIPWSINKLFLVLVDKDDDDASVQTFEKMATIWSKTLSFN